MATIPTTDCSFGDIVIAHNTTFPSTPVSTNNINLKTYFSGKTVYSPGGTGTLIPTSNISTSLFYGKTFGSKRLGPGPGPWPGPWAHCLRQARDPRRLSFQIDG